MRCVLQFSVLLMTASCGPEKPIDCDALNIAELEQCSAAISGSEVEKLVACLPFSEPIKTSGVWVVGFEKNDFFEGHEELIEEIMWIESTGANLMTDEELRPKTIGPQYRAVYVELVGRRALCKMAPVNGYPIAVEKLNVVKDLATRN